MWNTCSTMPRRTQLRRNRKRASGREAPERTRAERKTRFELATLALARRCATAAPLPLGGVHANDKQPNCEGQKDGSESPVCAGRRGQIGADPVERRAVRLCRIRRRRLPAHTSENRLLEEWLRALPYGQRP